MISQHFDAENSAVSHSSVVSTPPPVILRHPPPAVTPIPTPVKLKQASQPTRSPPVAHGRTGVTEPLVGGLTLAHPSTADARVELSLEAPPGPPARAHHFLTLNLSVLRLFSRSGGGLVPPFAFGKA